jgi:hypothetical protein
MLTEVCSTVKLPTLTIALSLAAGFAAVWWP